MDTDKFLMVLTRPSIQETTFVIEEDWTLELVCLFPKTVLSPLLSQCRALVLTSGTLSPLASVISELGLKDYETLEAPRLLSDGQLWAGILSRGPHGLPLKCTSETLKEEDGVVQELGSSLIGLVQVIH